MKELSTELETIFKTVLTVTEWTWNASVTVWLVQPLHSVKQRHTDTMASRRTWQETKSGRTPENRSKWCIHGQPEHFHEHVWWSQWPPHPAGTLGSWHCTWQSAQTYDPCSLPAQLTWLNNNKQHKHVISSVIQLMQIILYITDYEMHIPSLYCLFSLYNAIL